MGIFVLQWVYVLDIVHQVLGWCGLAAVDPALTAEVALRLALVFEASAALESSNKHKPGKTRFMLTLKSIGMCTYFVPLGRQLCT